MRDLVRSEFRCTGCGSIGEIDAPDGTLTLGMKGRPIDETAPTCACGGRRWVLVGSMTEFYAYTGRADVCRIGDHVDPRAAPYRLVRKEPAPPGPHLVLECLHVNACPDHVEVLRTEGLLGYYLVDRSA